GQNLLPIKFLRQIIGFYGDSLGGLVPRYLEQSMDTFAQNESHMRRAMQEAFKGLFPMDRFEQMGKQNMAIFENAMKMLNPFAQMGGPMAGLGARPASAPPEGANPNPSAKVENIDELKAQLNQM